MALISSVTGSGTISSAGVGSGLDVNSIVSKLMSVERLPINQIDAKTTTIEAEITAYGTLKSSLSSLQDSASALANTSTFSKTKATVGDSTQFTATTTTGAGVGNHTVQVLQLAQSQSLRSAGFTSATNSLGAGSLTFDFGTYGTDATTGITGFTANTNKKSVTVTIPAGSDSLSNVAKAINNANAGVTATVINDGSQYYLAFSPVDGGSANSLRITAADADGSNTDASGISRLIFDKSSGYAYGNAAFSSTSSTEITAALANNKFTIALDGGAAIEATIADGTYTSSQLVTAVQTAVDNALGSGKAKVSLNSSNQLQIAAQSNVPSRKVAAVVGNTGSSLIEGPKLNGASVSISNAAKNNQFTVALDGGATKTVTLADGTYTSANIVSAVQSALDSALGANTASVALTDDKLVVTSVATGSAATFGSISDNNGLSLVSGLKFTDPAGGVASVAVAAASSNNKFTLDIGGGATTVTIADGTYDAASFVGAFQAAVDTALGAGKAVVSYNSQNQIVVSAANSASSSIGVAAVDSNSGLATLFGTQTGTVSAKQNLTEKVAPVDAKLVIDGIPVTKPSNIVTDAIQGVTLNLLKTGTSSTTLSLTRDTEGIGTAVSGLVTAYNTASKMLASLLAYDASTGKAGALQSEGTVRSIQAQLSSTLQTVFGSSGLGGIASLSDLGVSFERDGTLAFDSDQLDTALSDQTKDIGAFFSGKNGTDGIATKLDDLLTSIVGSSGSIATRTNGLNETISNYSMRKTAMESRMATIEARYRQQFTNLDTLIASMNQTSAYLTQQLANLPSISGDSNK